ncbi:hypothetical protein CL176_03500 [Suicoccus acidiformans]|uniref:LysM domain-containing protein n=1 Tax=Suicoccus acidiformans TaxID=2036206 RepID=A0A347WJB4_9LACT|nr:LysM peptidoglycan-binding domain-containing protein [Suicoccus acidiformans]AXY25171.1 hypothetical protein CL176_03500 [Suicoccus acidiformans]
MENTYNLLSKKNLTYSASILVAALAFAGQASDVQAQEAAQVDATVQSSLEVTTSETQTETPQASQVGTSVDSVSLVTAEVPTSSDVVETGSLDIEESLGQDVQPAEAQAQSTGIQERQVASYAATIVEPEATYTPKRHQVKHGEYLYSIGQRYGVSVQNLKDWNNLNSNVIYSNMSLIVEKPVANSVASTPVSQTQTAPVSTSQVAPQTYTIQRGDYLNKIARQHGVSVADLKAWNNLSSNLIHPNQKLYVSNPNVKPAVSNQPVAKPQAQAPTPSATQAAQTYTIQRGDYLNKIARQHGVSVADLKAWNNLSSNLIHPNQKLYVSNPNVKPAVSNQSVAKPQAQAPTPSATQAAQTYTIQRGDYLNKIARQHGVSVADLKAWNNLSSNLIHPNQKLYVSNPRVQAKPVSQPEPTAPKPVATQTQAAQTYTIQRGDYLNKIARQHGVSVADLKAWNNLSSNLIHPNQKLYVSNPNVKPAVSNQPVAKPQVQAQTPSATQAVQTYTIQRGDYLNKIARQHGVSVADLKTWNNLSSNLIHPNQKLYVSNPNVKSSPAGSAQETKGSNNESTQALTTPQAPTRVAQPAAVPTAPKTHTVQKGEYLYLIAKRHGVSVDQLKQWNNLSSNTLYTGTNLIVSDPTNVRGNVVAQESAIADKSMTYPALEENVRLARQLNVPFLSQHDPRWKDAPYGNDVSRTIWENGCGIVSLAMVDSYFKGELSNPADITKWAGLRHYQAGAGTKWSIFQDFANQYGYKMVNHGNNFDSAAAAIRNGSVGITSVQPGYFINGGHLMVLRGVDNGLVYVNDPYDSPKRKKQNSFKGHNESYMRRDGRNYWTFSKS